MIDEKKLIEKSEWKDVILRFFNPEPIDTHSYNLGWNDCNKNWIERIYEQPKISLENKTSDKNMRGK